VWVWVEAASLWLARATGLPFAVLVKLPVIAGEVWIVSLLRRLLGTRAAWAYALCPVALLVSGVHGQFDALMLACVLQAIVDGEAGRHDRSALALSAAIALKTFPVLLLPLLLLPVGRDARLRWVALALGPVAVLLAPFAIVNLGGVRRELLGYGGVADLGWIGLVRAVVWSMIGRLPRSDARYWPTLVPLAKWLFLAAWSGIVAASVRGRLRLSRLDGGLAVFLAFVTLYGAVSAQYLLWPAALGLAWWSAWRAYRVAATVALAGLYVFVVPEMLVYGMGEPPPAAGFVWLVGNALVLACGLVWLAALVRRGWARDATP
jgi:hypothetical protein